MVANKGPKINPGLIKALKFTFLLIKNNERKIEPINVLIPTRLNGLISVVLIIMGMVPQEIAKTVIAA